MDRLTLEKLLRPPQGRVHAVIDTDTFNEVDDQFALAYLLRSPEAVQIDAIYAAPFLNEKAATAEEGMEKSLAEIQKVLRLAGAEEDGPVTLPGARSFLKDETTPVMSDAVQDLVARAKRHSKDDPLYVIAIAAATNIASALLAAPEIVDRIVIFWLGGSALHRPGEAEFNLMEDLPAARVLFRSGAALVQVPCWGVAEHFTVSRAELERHLAGHGALSDYLAQNTIAEVESYAAGTLWTKTIWDVTAAAWLLNRQGQFLRDWMIPAHCPEPDHTYSALENDHWMGYVYHVERDALMTDLFRKLTGRM